jgi:hypothetical protein
MARVVQVLSRYGNARLIRVYDSLTLYGSLDGKAIEVTTSGMPITADNQSSSSELQILDLEGLNKLNRQLKYLLQIR